MTVQTGRTVSKHVEVRIDDSGGTLRTIMVDTINGLGLTYDVNDLTAFMDAIHGVLLGHPDFSCTLSGPWDTTAVQTVGTQSGSHTVLSAINGVNTPLAFGVFVGIRHAWESGEPVFGITGTAANGVIVTSYEVDLNAGKYTAGIRMYTGSAAPAWGTSAIT